MTCPECGRKFTKQRPWQRYCRDECGVKQRNKRRARLVRRALARLDDRQAEQFGANGRA